MLNDLLTLARIREGDIKAFEDVFRRYYSPLCWYAMSITGSMEAAEEIVEELFYGFCIYNHRTTKTNQKYPSVNL